jgi:histone H4
MGARMGAGSKISPLLAAKSPRVVPPALGPGRKGMKRHAKRRALDGSAALSRPALRRLARRGGVKRIGAGIYEEVPALAKAWIGKIVRDAVVFTEHGRRKTVTTNDVVMALKRNGM